MPSGRYKSLSTTNGYLV